MMMLFSLLVLGYQFWDFYIKLFFICCRNVVTSTILYIQRPQILFVWSLFLCGSQLKAYANVSIYSCVDWKSSCGIKKGKIVQLLCTRQHKFYGAVSRIYFPIGNPEDRNIEERRIN